MLTIIMALIQPRYKHNANIFGILIRPHVITLAAKKDKYKLKIMVFLYMPLFDTYTTTHEHTELIWKHSSTPCRIKCNLNCLGNVHNIYYFVCRIILI